jgi:sulfoxide reductase heme-binding subunit YedZ
MQSSAVSSNRLLFKRVLFNNRVLLLKIAIHLMSLLPLIIIYYLAFADMLGADPVKEVIHFTGVGAFNLLLFSLTLTPLAKKFRQGYLLQTRRLIGLYSFTYAVVHLLSFLAFEVQFDFTLFVNEIIDRPYITVGMTALVILAMLALTSFMVVRKKMGKSWQRLHNWVYLAVMLVALHFIWSVKSDIVEPLIYIAMTVFLLYFRKQRLLRWFKSKS